MLLSTFSCQDWFLQWAGAKTVLQGVRKGGRSCSWSDKALTFVSHYCQLIHYLFYHFATKSSDDYGMQGGPRKRCPFARLEIENCVLFPKQHSSGVMSEVQKGLAYCVWWLSGCRILPWKSVWIILMGREEKLIKHQYRFTMLPLATVLTTFCGWQRNYYTNDFFFPPELGNHFDPEWL